MSSTGVQKKWLTLAAVVLAAVTVFLRSKHASISGKREEPC